MTENIERNLKTVMSRIAAACQRAGRPPEEVTLVAVTKTVGVEEIEALIRAGATDIGENRVQAWEEKAPRVTGKARRHMIGHLQRNKAAKALALFDVVDSADSLRLLNRLDRLAEGRETPFPVLLEVNTSGEEAKYGLKPEDVAGVLVEAASLKGLVVRGLMTMAPFTSEAEETRPVFVRLRELRDELNSLAVYRSPLTALSMGMTQDFEVAVEEGATEVRVGSALFVS